MEFSKNLIFSRMSSKIESFASEIRMQILCQNISNGRDLSKAFYFSFRLPPFCLWNLRYGKFTRFHILSNFISNIKMDDFCEIWFTFFCSETKVWSILFPTFTVGNKLDCTYYTFNTSAEIYMMKCHTLMRINLGPMRITVQCGTPYSTT